VKACSGQSITQLLSLAALGLALTGCQSLPGGGPEGDETGSLGVEQQAGPADTYVDLAIGYLQEGDVATALKRAKYALELDPNHAKGNGVIALIYERLGEDSLAAKHYQASLRRDPRNPYMLNAYGAFLCSQGDYDQAVQQYDKALENPLYSTPEVALTNAGICLRLAGDLSRAESYFRRALERENRFPQALAQMALVSQDRGNSLSARAYLERYLAVGPPSAELLWLGVRVERQLGDNKAADLYAKRLRETYPDSQEVQLMQESNYR
jgi:type IV pilus assembly protein PilF